MRFCKSGFQQKHRLNGLPKLKQQLRRADNNVFAPTALRHGGMQNHAPMRRIAPLKGFRRGSELIFDSHKVGLVKHCKV